VNFVKFLLSRTVTFLGVILIGVTIIFLVPRLSPTNPVDNMVGRMISMQGNVSADAVQGMRDSLNALFGLEGSVFTQYVGFLKRVILTHDFGPSLAFYPTPVMELVGRALPWTCGLLLVSTLIAFVVGNGIGLIAAIRKDKGYSKILESLAIVFYPIPYYILALILVILFCYIIPVFPLGYSFNGSLTDFSYWASIIKNSFLPALSIIINGFGWWVISMKSVATSVLEEDYVFFARLKGLNRNQITTGYILPNVMLPQMTTLALQLGTMFGGAMLMEMIFAYPGLGNLIYKAILQGDYNLIMGTITITIVAVAVTSLLIDLLYPLLDPRIRYK
jgi:peptide/nickel transport system permease protein